MRVIEFLKMKSFNLGPFQSLKPRKNTFKIWNGLPLVTRGQLQNIR